MVFKKINQKCDRRAISFGQIVIQYTESESKIYIENLGTEIPCIQSLWPIFPYENKKHKDLAAGIVQKEQKDSQLILSYVIAKHHPTIPPGRQHGRLRTQLCNTCWLFSHHCPHRHKRLFIVGPHHSTSALQNVATTGASSDRIN